ncbi:hypothetical protein RND71_025122 [Anisodus tanguticus]|uniref:Amidase domain-containing protein n=1 Tax=Anisodus tanguticus TaxID=243964 RepID=A0AAE1RSC7_9SOLA|nr:hypothetical protein RND71_025122 [Anisodus tanguticus]
MMARSGGGNGNNFKIEEATIKDIQLTFAQNKLTSRQLVDYYLHRIESLNPVLGGVIEVNLDVRKEADEVDKQRENNNTRSVSSDLHGIPVLLKYSIATTDKLNTTAGSYALLGSQVSRDDTVVERLRNAGALILGKATMTLLKMKNPYVERGNPCGSSSGSAISVAANMVAVSLGTETDGSIICSAEYNAVVGLKPTVGLTSRAGVIPLSPRQDTIGTVSDAVYVLDSIVGFDIRDLEATRTAAKFIPTGGYKQFLNEDGLKGKILGVVRHSFLALSNVYVADTVEWSCPDTKERSKSFGQEIFIAAEATKGIGEEGDSDDGEAFTRRI